MKSAMIFAIAGVFLLSGEDAFAAKHNKRAAVLKNKVNLSSYRAKGGEAFNGNARVATSVLSATVANTGVNVPDILAARQGNVIADGAFKETFGVVAVAQNSGTNAIIQQSVVVQTDKFSINF